MRAYFKKIRYPFLSVVAILFVMGVLHAFFNVPLLESVIARDRLLVRDFMNQDLLVQASTGQDKLVALTFDDGPDPRDTPQILDLLKKYNIKATFFVIGNRGEHNPDLLKRESQEGHEIENHTFTHPDLRCKSTGDIQDEIQKTQSTITATTGLRPHFFRPPFGSCDETILDLARKNGYETVLWTVCIEHADCKTPQDMAARVIKFAKPGMIILAHDGRGGDNSTIQALPMVIEYFQQNGYRFVTIQEMNSRYKPDLLSTMQKYAEIGQQSPR